MRRHNSLFHWLQSAHLVSRLARLHLASRRMKRKLRVLSRRQLALALDIEELKRCQPIDAGLDTIYAKDVTVDDQDPIWIHSGWRTGSTYFWNKFRSSDRYLAYYEPFHEALETLDATTIERATARSWPSGHPQMDAPYYAEYLPLLTSPAGVQHFRPTFPYVNYFLNDCPCQAQQAYLESLCNEANKKGLRPVFGFCRSSGRLPWFRRHMRGVHITLTRDGLGMWRSALDRKKIYGDLYFLSRPLIILFLARRDPWIADYFATLGLDKLTRLDDAGLALRQAEHIINNDPTLTARAFAAVHALGTALSQYHADFVVGVETLSTELGRRHISATLQGRYNINLNWDDCTIPIYPPRTEDDAFLMQWKKALILAERCAADQRVSLPASSQPQKIVEKQESPVNKHYVQIPRDRPIATN